MLRNRKLKEFKRARAHRIAAPIAALTAMVLAGCGVSTHPSAPSPSGTIQALSQPASGPVLGYAWDASGQALRPIKGVPGASILGNAIVSAPSQVAFTATAFSGVSGAALFLDANGVVYQSPLSQGKLTQIAKVSGASGLALSNSGAYAVVTGKDASGAGVAAVISGLPQSPSISVLDVSALGPIVGAAASDTGTVALASGSGANGVVLSAFAGQGGVTRLAAVSGFGGLQFTPNSDQLIFADGGSGALTAISHVNTAPASAVLATAGAIASPVALDITPNGRWVAAANHAGDVLRLDLTGTAATAKVHCVCAPTQVVALNGSTGGTTIRLVTAGGGPLWIVDAGGPSPRVLFVPGMPVPASATASIPTKSTM